jgi:hypothetical protein
LSRPDLNAEMVGASRSFSFLHCKRLQSLGVPWETVCELTGEGAVGVITASEGEDQTFYPDPDGTPQLVVPVIEGGEMVDLVAFRSNNPGGLLLRNGLGTALGLERGIEPYTWQLPSEAVPLHKTPLDWLRARRAGVVIIDWLAPDLRDLCGIPRIVCEDHALADRLRSALTRPTYLPDIQIKEMRLAA